MVDTPDHIKKIQLEIWLQKTPGERLKQFLIDNEALFRFWQQANKHINPAVKLSKKSQE